MKKLVLSAIVLMSATTIAFSKNERKHNRSERELMEVQDTLASENDGYVVSSTDSLQVLLDENILDEGGSLNTDSLTNSEERPEETYTYREYKPKLSSLHIPITINVSLIEKKLNEQFSDLIYEDAVIEDDSLMIRAWKANDFKINYENNVLQYSIPVKIWIKKRFGLGFTHTDQEIEGAINLDLKTIINFSKDWGLLTKTELLKYTWITKPVLKFGIVEIPITPIVDKILDKNRTMLSSTIDKTVKEYVPMAQYIQEVWSMVQDPLDLSATGMKAWLKITPKNLYTTPISGTNGQIKTTIGIQCLSEIYMDHLPAEKEKELSMPQLKMYSNTDEKACVNILADIPYSTIDTIANSMMKGESFGEGRHTIFLDSMEFYGQEDKLVIGVHVHGFINGAVYLSGTPYYEKETSSIRIKEVDYKLKTKNVLAKIVNLFYKKGLKSMIEEKVVISIKENLDWAKEMSRSELFNKELMENVYLNGMLNQLDVDGIYLTSSGLKASINLSGKFSLRIE